MKMRVPTPEESTGKKQELLSRFVAGILIFGLLSSLSLRQGLENVNLVTWLALGFGVLSFGFLSMRFGHEFWQRLLGTN